MTEDRNKIGPNLADQTRLSIKSAPFNAAARDYDAEFSYTALGMRKRSIVRKYVRNVLNPDDAVLELNCGTGEDALWMARRVRRVLATDSSNAMLHVVNEKRSAVGQENVDVRQLNLSEISEGNAAMLCQATGGPFDLVFSNFDGINCVNDLQPLFEGISTMVRPNGDVILIFMSSFCLAQRVISILRFESAKRTSRGRNRTRLVPIGPSDSVPTTFHTIRRVTEGLKTHGFRIKTVRGVGLTTPPTTVTHFYERHRRLFRLLNPIEDLLSPIPPFSGMCDHVLIHAHRTDTN